MESLIPLNDVHLDASVQTRLTIREDDVLTYAAMMTEGVVFPAIVLFTDGASHYIGDGFHRVLAARKAGRTTLLADLRTGTREDALWFALGANKHGHPLSTPDKKHAITLALAAFPDYSLNKIAEQIGCSRTWVQETWHSQQAAPASGGHRSVEGRNGHTYRDGVRITPESSRALVRQLLQEGKPIAEIKRIAHVSSKPILEEKARLGMSTRSSKVEEPRLDQMRAMARDGHSSRQIAEAVGIAFSTCRHIMRREGITVPADAVIGRTRRHDANRIVDSIVAEAANLVADVNLIDFAQLDRARLPLWLRSLAEARDRLGAFIRRLNKERGANNDEAA